MTAPPNPPSIVGVTWRAAVVEDAQAIADAAVDEQLLPDPLDEGLHSSVTAAVKSAAN